MTMHAPSSTLQAYLERLLRRFADLDGGRVATYIPELAKADPRRFAIVLATVDGQLYEVGDARLPFTLQSISKPLVYGAALQDRGPERVARAIGVEPSGDAFNSISLEPGSGRPRNPMINAGAIAAAALLQGDDGEARLARLLDALSAYAGRPLEIDAAVFESERTTGHRNRAIGHMLRNYGIVSDDPEPALELYFKQCSVRVDCRDLALMAATLANGGVHPQTGVRAVAAEHIGPILSVMTTCGMYDFSGEWVYRVGLPAKSGVGGGIMAVLPGQLGIGVYSPALDERGNSVRGVAVCEALSRDLGLHFLQPPRPAVMALRARYTLAGVRSKRRRPPEQERRLEQQGDRAIVYELQGDLRFATLEPVLRDIAGAGAELRFAVLDFKRVGHADAAAVRMLEGLVNDFAAQGRHLVLTRVRRGGLLAGFGAELDPRSAPAVSFQPQLDLGLEWCERGLLDGAGAAAAQHPRELAEQGLCAGLAAEDIEHLRARLQLLRFEPGALIVRRGEPADGLYLLRRGEVSVIIELPQGGSRRLQTLSAGMSFGELTLVSGGARSADVRADTAVECWRLGTAEFAALHSERPSLLIGLLRQMLRGSSETVVRLSGELTALDA
ncbi:glutaminase A [Roseateles violae]|uniref:Glutaminase n=1 Tax=Roseateles violae TaxID=3058042 RepID=A0ABT8DTA6_9BURK|nr:glutaminase A [Pelomonas sp. PFR6]MDN3920250.1 glutaminase A [Pelomonas sp. PFR6]